MRLAVGRRARRTRRDVMIILKLDTNQKGRGSHEVDQ